MLKHTKILKVAVIGLAVAIMLPAMASASSQSFYALNNSAKQGMLMSLTANPGVVEPASDQNAKSLVGVVAPPDGADFNQQAGQISVRTDGVASVLVSTLDGNISVGDRIGPSSLLGIGTKVLGAGWIVGTAQASLDSSSKNALKSEVTDSAGAKHTVYLASIPMLVKVTYYNSSAGNQATWVPTALQNMANQFANKHVSPVALILSFLVLIVGVLLAGMIIYSAIRGGMLAISRQPLTKSLIQRKVLQSFGMAVLILVVVTVAVMLLLRYL